MQGELIMKKVDAVIKTKILGYFNKHKLDKLYLNTFINEVGYKNAKYSDLDILNFLCDYLIEIINSDKQSYNLIQKLVLFIYDIFCQLVFEKKVIREDVYKKVLNTEVIFNKYVDENNLSKDEFVVKYINKVNELIEKSNKPVVNMSNVDENGDIKEKTNTTITFSLP